MAPAVGKTHAGPLNAYERGAFMLNAVLLNASELKASELKASEPQSMCASMWALRRSPGMLILVRVNYSGVSNIGYIWSFEEGTYETPVVLKID